MEVRHIIVIVLTAAYIVCGGPEYLADPAVSGWVKALTYHLFHANVFHLAANCLSVWFMFRTGTGRSWKTLLRQLAIGFVIATLTYFTATRPIIGVSNILFAILGLRTPAFSNPWWKSRNTIVFLSVTVLMIFFPQFSAVTHIISFICGVTIAVIRRKVISLDNDIKHATNR